MLDALLLELLFKSIALAVTVWAAHHLTTAYLEALLEFARVYLSVLELVHAEERLPLRT